MPVLPGSDALRHAQDKVVMRERLAALGVPVPAFTPVGRPRPTSRASAGTSAGRWCSRRRPAATTARASGSSHDLAEAAEAAAQRASGCWPRSTSPLDRELAAVVARSPFGQGAAWPVVETVQHDGICVEVVAPAPGLCEERRAQAQELALRLADELDVVGRAGGGAVRDRDGHCVVNELAMRPHNSGHWTIEGSRTSQFEQHLRAVLDYPLGATGADRAGGRDGQRARRRGRPPTWTGGCTSCWPRPGRSRSTCTARGSGPGARSATSPRSATTSSDVPGSAARARGARLPAPTGRVA